MNMKIRPNTEGFKRSCLYPLLNKTAPYLFYHDYRGVQRMKLALILKPWLTQNSSQINNGNS